MMPGMNFVSKPLKSTEMKLCDSGEYKGALNIKEYRETAFIFATVTPVEMTSASDTEQGFKQLQTKYKKTSDKSEAPPEMKLYDYKARQRVLMKVNNF